MKFWPMAAAIMLFSAAAAGQTARPPAAPSADKPALPAPKNLENTLNNPVTIDASHTTLLEFTDSLRNITQTNLTVNWNALSAAGISRDTPVHLKLKDVAYEQVIHTLVEVLPATGTRANYVVDDNALTLTTNAELGKAGVGRFSSMLRAASYAMDHAITPEDQQRNSKVIEAVLKAELVRAGEPMDLKGHSLEIKDLMMAVTVSQRGQAILKRAENMFNAPLRIGQLASGTSLSASAKKAQDAFSKLIAGPNTPPSATRVPLATLARDPAPYQNSFNIALLPGTAEALAKPTPDLAYAINEGGVILIGPHDLLRKRTVLAIYDLRDLIRRLNFKNARKANPTALEYQTAIVTALQDEVKPDGPASKWDGVDDLGKNPDIMIPYNGLLIVFATPEVQRTIAGGLSDMNK